MTEPFRFCVRDVFVLTGRGTAVIGYIEAGSVRAGDDLTLAHHETRRTVRCEGVGAVRDSRCSDEAAVGLLIPELSVTEVSPGDFLTRP